MFSAAAEEEHVPFQVVDTGPGLERADLGRLFDRFWQGEKREAGGSGLRLTIARGLVEAQLRLAADDPRLDSVRAFPPLPGFLTRPSPSI